MEKKKYLTTGNIRATLYKFSKVKKVDFKKLDFKLVDFEEKIKTSKDEDFTTLTKDAIYRYEDKKYLILQDEVELIQSFNIIPVLRKANPYFSLRYKVEKGEYNTHPELVIKNSSIFSTRDFKAKDMFRALYREVIKIKAYHGIAINLLNNLTLADLKRFIKDLYSKNFVQDVKINLFNGLEPEETVKADNIEHYKLKTNEKKQLIEVEENELLVEYIKPKFGKNGFNANGKIIDSELHGTQVKPNYVPDEESILVEEDDDKKKLYAKFKGYVYQSKKFLEVRKQYVVGDIHQTDKSVTDTEINDIEVVISEKDLTKDGVGEGSSLVSQKVKITGAVGKNATVKAKEAYIEGMTHSRSKVFGKTVVINRHLGEVRAANVHVKSLEGGKIYATHAKIDNIISGMVSANTIEIGTLKNNGKIYGGSKIAIERVTGEDSRICIDVNKVEVLQKKAGFIREEIQEIKDEMASLKGSIKNTDQVSKLKEELEKKEQELEESFPDPFKAKIVIKEPVAGHNIVSFYTRKYDKLIETKTLAGIEYEPFSINYDPEIETITLHPTGEVIDLA